jgi:Rrf2 family protein
MISQTAEYALRAMVFLADHTDPKTTQAISAATQVPTGYLAKVMQSLSRGGLVKAQRGLHGGFTLASPATKTTILQVINAVDPVRRFHECPLGLHGVNLCPLHRKLDDAAREIEANFGDTTVAELVNLPRHLKPLCGFPTSTLVS